MEALANSAFTTSGALIDCVDKKMMLVLRDNTKLIGVLRSFDQYGNLVLQDSIERIHIEEYFADVPKGVFLIRGENVVLMGEIDLDEEDNIRHRQISPQQARERINAHHAFNLDRQKEKSATLHKLGFVEIEDDLYLLN